MSVGTYKIDGKGINSLPVKGVNSLPVNAAPQSGKRAIQAPAYGLNEGKGVPGTAPELVPGYLLTP